MTVPIPHHSPRIVMTRALKYLAEKFPGIVSFMPSSEDTTLNLNIGIWSSACQVFISRFSVMCSHMFRMESNLAGKSLHLSATHRDPKVFASTQTYLTAFFDRYPDIAMSLEAHLPVVEQLLNCRQEWDVIAAERERLFNSEFHNHPGWGNGYVGVCSAHPWFKKHYDQIDVYAPGGLTYANMGRPKNRDLEPNGLWWVGFDTAHWNDTLARWPKELVVKEAQYLYLKAAWVFAGVSNPVERG